MTIAATPLRRGACPGLAAPMPTGDGLLVRLSPTGTIPLPALAQFCAAARAHGNGVIEITSRGSIQVRGLSVESAPQFAAAVAALGIAAADGVPILCNPLAGLDDAEILDAGALAADLRQALTRAGLSAKLSPKVSVAIDGGGELHPTRLAADIRLCAETANGGVVLHLGVGGDAAGATHLGLVAVADAIEATMRLLGVIAGYGCAVRARDILAADGAEPFRAAIAEFLTMREAPPATRRSGDAIGTHRLRDGALACGIGLAFGHVDATRLARLTDAAHDARARGIRVAPHRALLAIGLAPADAARFAAAAARLGFVARAGDPRRRVIACAGAPICASAHIAARAIGPAVAAKAGPHLGDAAVIHISGCSKGCAHASPAALTVTGTAAGCALIAAGTARDTPFAVVAPDDVPDAIARFLRRQSRQAAHA